MTLPPGPRGPHPRRPPAGSPAPAPTRAACASRYGDTFTLHVDRRAPWVVLSHPDDVKQVFTGDPNVLHAGEGNAILQAAARRAQRPAARRPGAHARAQAAAAAVPRRAHAGLRRADPRDRRGARSRRWPAGEPIATRPRMQALTLEIIMRAVFGTRDERLRDAAATLLDWIGRPAALDAARARRPAAQRARDFAAMRAPIDALLSERIAERRAAPDARASATTSSRCCVAATDMDDADACATSC